LHGTSTCKDPTPEGLAPRAWHQGAPSASSSAVGNGDGQSLLPRGNYRPRDTRSISAFTMRSTSPGRLSSSQDFSIGRSISLTRSSKVRALWLSTVWASVLKADSTADTVDWDKIGG